MNKLAIFCGSKIGRPEDNYSQLAQEMATVMDQQKIDLVYGGASIGLMGLIADAVLSKGRCVYGVIPQKIMDFEVAHKGLTELKVVESMHDRKFLMYEMSDAMVAIPGGIGTLDELFEAYTWRHLGYHQKPLGLLNINGFYDHLIKHMDQLVEHQFMDIKIRQLVKIHTDFSVLINLLNNEA